MELLLKIGSRLLNRYVLVIGLLVLLGAEQDLAAAEIRLMQG